MAENSGKGQTVVLVEGDEELRTRLAGLLEKEGLDVESAATPSVALAFMRKKRPDAVVTGGRLPETSTAELCRTVRRFPGWELLPIWVVDTGNDASERCAWLDAGADGVIGASEAECLLAAHLRRAAARRHQEGQLAELQCIKTLERAAATIGYHLTTPANFITMCSELLVEPFPEGSEVRILAGKIEHQLDRIRGLVPRLKAVRDLGADPAEPDPEMLCLPCAGASERRAGPVRALVVDDEPEVRTLVRSCLERSGKFEVIEATNGQEGVELARRERPHLIVFDLVMPVMDGAKACEAIRSDPALRRTTVVMLTMMTNAEEMVKLFELGASGYLVKPFDVAKLPGQLLRILERQVDPG